MMLTVCSRFLSSCCAPSIIMGLTLIALFSTSAHAVDEEATELIEGQPIETGFVIVSGRWIAPPYVVAQRGDALLVNGVPFDVDGIRSESSRRRDVFGGFGRREGGRDSRRGGWQRPPRNDADQPSGQTTPREAVGGGQRAAGVNGQGPYQRNEMVGLRASIEQTLVNEGLLIQFNSDTSGLFQDSASIVLEILASDESSPVKVQRLLADCPPLFSSDLWLSLVDTCELPAAMRENWSVSGEELAYEFVDLAGATGPSYVTYSMTVIGMLLTVFSLAVVLSYRPKLGVRWSQANPTEEAVQLVVRCVVLIGLLSVFDLVCTQMANKSGDFLELNPLGAMLLGYPILMAGVKLAFTLMSAVILFKLRLYHGAQLASWWLCMVLALLAVRWVTYSSMVT